MWEMLLRWKSMTLSYIARMDDTEWIILAVVFLVVTLYCLKGNDALKGA